jgi:hypothetical protein
MGRHDHGFHVLGMRRDATLDRKSRGAVKTLVLFSALVASCADRAVRATAAAAALAAAASASPSDSDVSAVREAALPAAPADAALPPLQAAAELVPLAVPNYRDAIVSVPLGATEARPVVLALHGNYDRPEWQCGVWREATRAYPFVLCPRGVPRPDAPASLDRWTYGRSPDVRREIDAALASLRARFGDYLLGGPIVYVGFSLGAIIGVGIVSGDAEQFPRAVLIEGGQSGWSAARARAYAASGGKRILFACGQRSCKSSATSVEKILVAAGLEARVAYGGEIGHTYDGPVAREIARAWDWLVAGDAGWAALRLAP